MNRREDCRRAIWEFAKAGIAKSVADKMRLGESADYET